MQARRSWQFLCRLHMLGVQHRLSVDRYRNGIVVGVSQPEKGRCVARYPLRIHIHAEPFEQQYAVLRASYAAISSTASPKENGPHPRSSSTPADRTNPNISNWSNSSSRKCMPRTHPGRRTSTTSRHGQSSKSGEPIGLSSDRSIGAALSRVPTRWRVPGGRWA